MTKGIILHQGINIFKLNSIENLCRELGIELSPVTSEDRDTPLEILLKRITSGNNETHELPVDQKKTTGSLPVREMLIFCGLAPDLFDTFLTRYHSLGISPVKLKAVLTVHNAKWTPRKLQAELEKESQMFDRQNTK